MTVSKPKVMAALVAMTVLFGASFPGSKIALEAFTPSELVFLRFAIGCCAYLIFSPWLKATPMDRRGYWRVFLLTLFEPGIYFYLEAAGIQRTLASTAAILICTIPIYVLALEALWLKVPVVWSEAGLIVVSMGGITLLVSAGNGGRALGGSATGNLFILGAALAASIYTVLARRLLQRYNAVAVSRLQIVYAAAMYLPLAGWDLWRLGPPAAGPRQWAAVAYLGVACSFLAYLLLNVSLTHLKASLVSAFTNVIPVVATALAILLLGERLYPLQAVGAAVTVLAVSALTLVRPGGHDVEVA